MFSSSERFYLIEVKGGVSDIASEWTGGNSRDRKKRLYSALAYRWKLLESAASEDDKDEVERLVKFFSASLACHLFSYWEEWELNGIKVGDVVVVPYLAGCIRQYAEKVGQEGYFISNIFGAEFWLGEQRRGQALVSEVASVDILFKRNAKVFTSRGTSGKPILDWGIDLGLTLPELQAYINELAEDEGDIPEMHGVVMDTSGQVFKSYASMADLKLALDPYAQMSSTLKSSSLQKHKLQDLLKPAEIHPTIVPEAS